MDAVASGIAEDFAEAILARKRRLRDDDLDVEGLENQLTNEVMLTSDWSVKRDWKFTREGHINLLEIRAIHRLVRDQLLLLPKGRSSSKAITALLRRIDVELILGGTYLVTPFVPTRHNCADDPTRLRELRRKVEGMALENFEEEDLYKLGMLKGSKRWASNWIRLCLLIAGPSFLHLRDRSSYRRRYPLDFDATLGFPGEGPLAIHGLWTSILFSLCISLASPSFGFWTCSKLQPCLCPLATRFGLWICSLISSLLSGACSSLYFSFYALLPPLSDPGPGLRVRFEPWRLKCAIVVCLVLMCPSCSAMDLGPRNAGDAVRAGTRVHFGPLPDGRVVVGATAHQRRQHLETLFGWSSAQGVDVVVMIENYQHCLEELNIFLCRFGRALYDSGRPFNHFIECLNAITSWQPNLRRQLQRCWDLAFNWVRQEPSVHHVAAPYHVLLAMLAICLFLGMDPVGVMFGSHVGWPFKARRTFRCFEMPPTADGCEWLVTTLPTHTS